MIRVAWVSILGSRCDGCIYDRLRRHLFRKAAADHLEHHVGEPVTFRYTDLPPYRLPSPTYKSAIHSRYGSPPIVAADALALVRVAGQRVKEATHLPTSCVVGRLKSIAKGERPMTPEDLRAEIARRQVRLYQLASRIGVHPGCLGQILNERLPMTEELAACVEQAPRNRSDAA